MNILNEKSRYVRRALKLVDRFMDEMGLFSSSGRGVVAVSGGMDSMVLLWMLQKIFEKRSLTLVAVHINHNTRAENSVEAEGVTLFAKSIGVEVEHFTLAGLDGPNFEKTARDERYRCFNSLLKKGDRLYTAHHIDDSFEWSMLARLKSGSFKSTLGIPVVRGAVARPFLTMTREQIARCASFQEIPYFSDPSNKNISYERNYLRTVTIPTLKSRFPKYLKHYVYNSNDLARKLLLHVNVVKKSVTFKTPLGTVLFNRDFSTDFSSLDETIIEIIRKISKQNRGVLRSQVKKLIEASKNGKSGPLLFSGGVECYLLSGVLFFASVGQRLDISLRLGAQIPAHCLQKEFLAGRGKGYGIVFSSDLMVEKTISKMSKTHPLLKYSVLPQAKSGLVAYSTARVIREIEKSPRKYLNSSFIFPDIKVS